MLIETEFLVETMSIFPRGSLPHFIETGIGIAELLVASVDEVAASASAAFGGRTETPAERSPAEIRAHYEIEKELAARLRRASREERRHLYSSLYDELFRRVATHPQLTQKRSSAEARRYAEAQLAFLKRFLQPRATFVEIGPGDCSLSFAVSDQVHKVFAVDVSDVITRSAATPRNFRLVLSDGCSIPVSPGSVNVAYSNQLMEHLHPDDAFEQLRNIYRALAPGGRYVCITPNSLNGPHDVSQFFDDVATGFHLKEYTVTELREIFSQAGFSKIHTYVGARGLFFRMPAVVLTCFERLLLKLPPRLRRRFASVSLCRPLLNVRIVGVK